MKEQKNTKRTWGNLNDESFKKIQDLQAVLANNEETIKALQESIEIHTEGLTLLTTERSQIIREQFEYIIEKHTSSLKNLTTYNENAKMFLSFLEKEDNEDALFLITTLLKLVAFK